MVREPIRDTPDGIEIDLLVVPNASRDGIVGVHGDRVKIRVTSPPEKNKANAAVIEVLREATRTRRVEIIGGRTGRHKTVLVRGAALESVRKSLA